MDVYPSVSIGSERYNGDAIALLRQVDGMRFAVPSEADNRLCFTDGTLEGVLLPIVRAEDGR